MIELLVFGLIVLSTVCLWLLIEQRKSWKFLIWFIPTLLILITSTYLTYTSLLGLPKVGVPEHGLYLKHHIDEPKWIYIWVLEKNNIPKSYQIIYSREKHNALEGVKTKANEGKFMIIRKAESTDMEETEKKEGGENSGFTIGGDVGFYEWDHTSDLPPKNNLEETK